MHREELLEEAAIGDLLVVEDDLHHLGVASASGADLFVGWCSGVTAHVADSGFSNARHLPEATFGTPETSGCKICGLAHTPIFSIFVRIYKEPAFLPAALLIEPIL